MQSDPAHIPHLLDLLDDESPLVQKEVYEALKGYENQLEHLLTPYLDTLGKGPRARLQRVCADIRIERFRAHWLSTLLNPEASYHQALEDAMSWLAYLQSDWAPEPLSDLLDQLERQFRQEGKPVSIDELMYFLFVHQGFMAPDKEYYHPRNSNLVTVIHRRRGLQISLSCLAILMGNRLELDLYGFNMPGHFMVMGYDYGMLMIYDVFNQGRPLPAQTHAYLEQSLTMQEVSLDELIAPPYQIVLRVLRNMVNAYEKQGEPEQARFFQTLLKELSDYLTQLGLGS